MNDLISVIVPVYNVKNYLEKCLDSIINQTYKNLEIILINDGSTDESLDICYMYEKKDNRIKVYNQENHGLSYTRNRGIELARGKYIGFLDSDDVISPFMYEFLYKAINEYNSKISICDFVRFSDKPTFNETYESISLTKIDAIKELMIDKKIANHAVDKLYLRELFDDVKFPVGKKYEDISTIYKLFLKSEFVSYVPCNLYGYYFREGSITGCYNKSAVKDYIKAINERYENLYDYNNELNLYLDMNRVNSILRCFLDIAQYKCISVLKDKEYKNLLYNELVIAKKLNTKDVQKINTKKKNILVKLLFLNPYIFYYIMYIYFNKGFFVK